MLKLDRVKKNSLYDDNSKQLDDAIDRNGWRNLVEVYKSCIAFLQKKKKNIMLCQDRRQIVAN